jgi:glutathione S-transferase
VTLYERPDCHLCDEARAGLERLRADGVDFEIEEINIEVNDELHARFLERIPVIELDGEIVSELFLDPDGLRARLRS